MIGDMSLEVRNAFRSDVNPSQVDGPAHFTVNTLQLLGPTLLKQRQLAAAGWHLISVPFHEWTRLRGRDAKQVLLKVRWRLRGGCMGYGIHAVLSVNGDGVAPHGVASPAAYALA